MGSLLKGLERKYFYDFVGMFVQSFETVQFSFARPRQYEDPAVAESLFD